LSRELQLLKLIQRFPHPDDHHGIAFPYLILRLAMTFSSHMIATIVAPIFSFIRSSLTRLFAIFAPDSTFRLSNDASPVFVGHTDSTKSMIAGFVKLLANLSPPNSSNKITLFTPRLYQYIIFCRISFQYRQVLFP
jgi:hypothetical protein